jgi:hypothetical protein
MTFSGRTDNKVLWYGWQKGEVLLQRFKNWRGVFTAYWDKLGLVGQVVGIANPKNLIQFYSLL